MPADVRQLDAVFGDQLHEVLKLAGLAVQPVHLPHRDAFDHTVGDVGAEPFVVLAAAGGGADVVVAVFDGTVPVQALAQLEHVLALAADGELDFRRGRGIGAGSTRSSWGYLTPSARATRGLHAHHIWHWEDGGLTELDNLVLVCPYHHRLHHRGVITITGPAHQLTVTDSAGRALSAGSLARAPKKPPPAVAPCRGPTGERADWWWYDPFQPQPPPTNN